MKRGIVWKLFVLTTSLCVLILTLVFVGQTLFFKQFYVTKKVADAQSNLRAFEQQYADGEGDAQAAGKLEQTFYDRHNLWVAPLDQYGNLEHSDDFALDVKLLPASGDAFAGRTITVPLYGLMNGAGDIRQGNEFVRAGKNIVLEAIQKGDAVIPYRIGLENDAVAWENNQIAVKHHELAEQAPGRSSTVILYGIITATRLPAGDETPRFVYSNQVFIERMKAFQATLLLDTPSGSPPVSRTMTVVENDIKYKVLVDTVKDRDGTPSYRIAMTSLQPVDEAVRMIRDYYVYLLLFVLLLALLTSFYYSKRIARPLLQINRTTRNIANLDFSEKIPITSNDEIGDLSRNINALSDALHTHIAKLQQDIAKEKQLEHTRKEFIAGVSHELKTPLSVIQSCISILKDRVAEHKRDYYFAALEREVRSMDLLIVDMLELAKMESGTYAMRMDSFRIDLAIARICDKLTPEMSGKQLELRQSLVPGEVIGNQHRIEQVLVNFVTNAIRHSPEQATIRIATSEEAGMVQVRVENTGTHIEEEHLAKIWDRFYRGESSRSRMAGGTGLGLAICKKILELHGVPYGACNTADGVVFYFQLPTDRKGRLRLDGYPSD